MLGKLLATTKTMEVTQYSSVTFMGNSYKIAKSFDWLQTLFNVVSWVLIPLFIAVAAGGAIYAVVLGVNLARAEDAERRDAAKKRLIWAIVGFASIIVLILLLNFLMRLIPNWISDYNTGDIYTNADGVTEYYDGNDWKQVTSTTGSTNGTSIQVDGKTYYYWTGTELQKKVASDNNSKAQKDHITSGWYNIPKSTTITWNGSCWSY